MVNKANVMEKKVKKLVLFLTEKKAQ